MRNILIVYYHRFPFPLRKSIEDHLYSFHRYSAQRCFYLNMAARRIPGYILRRRFDVIVFHTTFLCGRWSVKLFDALRRRAARLKDLDARKVALPQDEFCDSVALCDFINEFGIDRVFSVASPSEWPKIYETVDRSKIGFTQVLTGYLSRKTVTEIDALAERAGERTIDIGYRAWQAELWLGRHGLLKTLIAERAQLAAETAGLVTDISNRQEDTFLGRDWYRFLLSCKYTIGVEGGASILDRDGSIREATNAYTADHPDASFEQVEAACFAGLDGGLNLRAVSPRHLEACVTRTCQVLVEGEYNGVLEGGRHYIEVKRDFSNLDEVMAIVRDDRVRDGIVTAARADVVDSGRYSYASFVEQVLTETLDGAAEVDGPARGDGVAHARNRLAEALAWAGVAVYCKLRAVLRLLRIEEAVRRLIGRGDD